MKSRRSPEQARDGSPVCGMWVLTCGLGDLGMRKRTRMGCRSARGGRPLAISMAVMPSDQMSACGK